MEDIIQRLIYVPDYLASDQNLRETLKAGKNDRKEGEGGRTEGRREGGEGQKGTERDAGCSQTIELPNRDF